MSTGDSSAMQAQGPGLLGGSASPTPNGSPQTLQDFISQLQPIMSQLGPSDAERHAAQKQFWMTLGASMMGARKGSEGAAVGQGLAGGMQAQQAYLKNISDQRHASLQDATGLMGMYRQLQQQAMVNQIAQAMSGGGQPTPSSMPSTEGAVGGTGMGGGTAAMFGLGSQPGPVAGGDTTVPQNQTPDYRNKLGTLALQLKMLNGPDITPNLSFMLGKGMAARPGAPIVNDLTGEVMNPNPAAPPGTYWDQKQQKFVRVSNADKERAQSESIPELVKLALTPQEGIIPGTTKTGVVGNKFASTFPGAQLPSYLQGIVPGSAPADQSQAPAPPPNSIAGVVPQSPMQATMLGNALNKAGINSNYVQDPQTGQFSLGPGHGTPIQQSRQQSPAQSVQTKLSPEETSRSTEYGNLLPQIDAEGNAAQVARQRLAVVRSLADTIQPGQFNNVRQMLGRVFVDMGADQDAVSKWLGSVSGNQIFAKNANQLALDNTSQLGKGQAFQALQFVADANPNRQLTPDAIKSLVDEMDSILARQQLRQQEAHKFIQGGANANSLQDFDVNFNQAHPLKFPAPQSAPASGGGWTITRIK